jgi:hypothetical protein
MQNIINKPELINFILNETALGTYFENNLKISNIFYSPGW